MQGRDVFTWKIAGVGGSGLQIASSLLAKMFVRGGWYAHAADDFPSVVKGGPATGQVTVSRSLLRSHRRATNLLVSLTERGIAEHEADLLPGGWLMYDRNVASEQSFKRQDIVAFPVPITDIIRDIGGEMLMRNMVALGVTLGLVGFPPATLQGLIQEEYARKGARILDEDLKAVEAGVAFAREHAPRPFPWPLGVVDRKRRRLISGNDALAIGAVTAGCSFYAAYPMTPSTSILTFLAKHGPDYGMVVRQLQDEIAVINEAIGAAHAGVRAMVGSSGGGIALMIEGIGLAAMTETPLVIIDAQRPGPATGLPTWTEQGDLQFMLHAAHGDFTRVVLAPGDPAECFAVMPLAFNIADRYQLPVVVMTDKYLAECLVTTDPFSTKGITIDRGLIVQHGAVDPRWQLFPRYAETPTGVAPRPLPGTLGLPYMANSDEHDPVGLVNEEATNRQIQHGRRLRKMDSIRRDVPPPATYGSAEAPLSVLAWGSVKGPLLDALDLLAAEGLQVNAMLPLVISPFPTMEVANFVQRAKHLVIIDGNASGQFANVVQEHLGRLCPNRILRCDGRQFEATELAAELRQRMEARS